VTGARWDPSGIVRIATDAPEGGLLVVSLLHSSDWRVFVDGTPGAVLRVNGIVLGVEVPPGAREVRFELRVRGLATGIVLAALGASGLAAFVALSERRSRSGG
jgi:hypothetical protein